MHLCQGSLGPGPSYLYFLLSGDDRYIIIPSFLLVEMGS
jgi:hypothetical protein